MEILARVVGDGHFCLSDVSTVRDANEGMHPIFCNALLESVLQHAYELICNIDHYDLMIIRVSLGLFSYKV